MIPFFMSTPQKPERIVSLDFWRGAFLLMIYVNHVPNNFLASVTLRNWGFADSAEPFVFISGFSAMLALGRYFETGGIGIGLLRVLKRIWQLFCAHVLLVFALSAIIAFAGEFTDSKSIMEQLNFSPFFVETDIAIKKLLKLGYMPNLTDILPLYIVLVFLFPIAWALTKTSSLLALLASLSLWLFVTLTNHSLSNYPEGAVWFFNPLAWQVLFVAGMVTYKERARLPRVLQSNSLLWLSLIIVFASMVAVAPWTHIPSLREYRLVPTAFLSIDNKTNLSWVRIVHFMALAFLAARLVPASASLWKNRIVKAVSLCGQHSLTIYCAGSALSLAAHIILHIGGLGPVVAMWPVAAGVVLLVFLAMALQTAKVLLMHNGARSKIASTAAL